MLIQTLLMALTLGTSAGFSPGPLSTLVITHTLQHGFKEGFKVAMAPLFTDVPIIVVSLLLLSRFAHAETVLGIISLVGALFITKLAISSLRTKGLPEITTKSAPQSYMKGIAVNFLSPNPYLFWSTVGAPATLKAWHHSPGFAVAFLSLFYFCLLTGKVSLAVIASKARPMLSGKPYIYFMRFLGLLLLLFAFFLLRDGVRLLFV